MKKLSLQLVKLVCLPVFFMLTWNSSMANPGGPGSPEKPSSPESPNSVFVAMTITNCAAGANYFEYKVNVTNNSTASEVIYLNTMTFRMNHAAAIVPAGTNTYSFGYVASSADAKVAPWYQTLGTTYNTSYTASSRLMQATYATSVLGNSGASVNCPIQPGETVCLGKFRLTITNTNFVAGQTASMTWVTTSGITVYVGTATTTTNLNTTTFRSLGTPCSSTIPSVCSATSSNNSASACSSYLWNGTTYTSSGTYTQSGLTNAGGCDSTAYLNLTINQPSSSSETVTACSSYLWNGTTYTSSGTYTQTGLTNAGGCDSTAYLDLTITSPTENSNIASACDSYTWPLNGTTYTQSGSYTYLNTATCVNEILNLTITPSGSNTTTANACDSYTWAVNGQTYTSSGFYSSVSGCNTEVLDLTISATGSNATTVSACDSYTWSVNGNTYTQSGYYTSISGCTTEILDLTITLSNSNTTTVSACDSYTWAVNGQTYTSSGFYTSVSGCNIEILDLLINQPPDYPNDLECYQTAIFNPATCSWDVTGSQPDQPTLACYESATFNGVTCQWDVTGTQPAYPAGLACYESATFNGITCQWDVTGTQPAYPTGLACYESATFNGITCQWDVTGTQPDQPTLACYESATFNGITCQWDVTGTQPAYPTGLACYESATFNGITCQWDVTGSQPEPPSTVSDINVTYTGQCAFLNGLYVNAGLLNGYYDFQYYQGTDTFHISYDSSKWVLWVGNYENNGFMTSDNTSNGLYPPSTGWVPTQCGSGTLTWTYNTPLLACYQTASFDTTTCQWNITGTQPPQPTLKCYEIATFNNATCSWDISIQLPPIPTDTMGITVTYTGPCSPLGGVYVNAGILNGYYDFQKEMNGDTLHISYDGSHWVLWYDNYSNNGFMTSDSSSNGLYPPSTGWVATLCNSGTLNWTYSTSTLACYQTATFDSSTCQWNISGTQPQQPVLACYETATFNDSTCTWDVTVVAPETQSTSISACESYTWNGITYTASGSYTYTTLSALGCDSTTILNLIINNHAAIAGSASVISNYNGSAISCPGSSDAEIMINTTSYYPNLEYNINGGAYQNNNSFANLSAGTYQFSVKDSNGCILNLDSLTITDPTSVQASITGISHPNCSNPNGSVTLAFSGGTVSDSSYTITWVGSETGAIDSIASPHTINDLTSGSYNFSVTDLNGCSDTINNVQLIKNNIHNKNTGIDYSTIQAAINAATAGDTIEVCAGTYTENITINKSIDLRGPNCGISPNTGTRAAEAILLPATNNTSTGAVVTISAGNASFRGFTVDGDNGALPASGVGLGGTLGTSIDAARAIFLNANGINNVNIAENIAKNAVNGIRVEQTTNYFATTAGALFSYGVTIHDNKVQDMTGTGIRLGNSMFAKVTHNTITNVDNGVAFSSFRIKHNGNAADRVIANNTISARYAGIWVNLFHTSPYAISNNTITVAPEAVNMAPTPQNRIGWYGIMYSTVSSPQNFTSQTNLPLVATPEYWTCSNNNIDASAIEADATAYGYWLYYVDNNRDNLGVNHFGQITGGTVTGTDYGIMLKNRDTDPATNFGTAATGAHADISGVTFNTRTGGTAIRLIDDATWTTSNPAPLINKRTVQLGTGAGIAVNGGATGLNITHPAVGTANYTAYSSIASGTLNDIAFSTQTGDYVQLNNHPNELNATSAFFDGLTGATASIAQNFAIEDKIYHKIDNSKSGLVRVRQASIFVTKDTNDLQWMVDLSASGDTINMKQGSYDGNVDLVSSGKNTNLSMGASPGCVTINGNFSMNSGDGLIVEAYGNTACSQYDQLTVNGNVSIGGASLNLTIDSAYTPSTTDRLVIINNDGTDAISGTFAQGSSITVGSYTFAIIYDGEASGSGTGNDVVLALIPTISCPADVTQANDTDSCSAVVNGIAPVYTGYDASVTYSISGATTASGSNDASGTTFNKGISTVTYIVTDAAGFADTCTFQVTINDTTRPTFTRPADITIYTDGSCGFDSTTAATGDVINEADNCSTGINATYSDNTVAGSCQGNYVITRTWSLPDNDGNFANQQVQIITVSDTTRPTFTRPADITIYTVGSCGFDSTIVATGDVSNETDNCSTGINATYSDNTVAGSCQGTYVITRTWSLVDNCGNAADQQVQTITVSDTTRPSFTRPADITIYTDGSCGFDSTTAATGDVTNEADNCSTGINATYSDNTIAGSCQGTYVITRTWSLVDNCGNAADQQVQTITVSDTTRPSFTRPADITIYTDGSCGFDSTTAATGDVTNEADNCSTGINATYSDNTVAGSCQGTYVITRTWSLVDNCGNAADQQIQIITVSDTTRPSFTIPADITLYKNANCLADSSIAITGDVTDETDNCSTGIEAVYTDSVITGCQGSYVINRKWKLTDNCGNVSFIQIQTITVSDTTRPSFTRPADITIYTDGSCEFDSTTAATGDVTNEADNCSTGINASYSDNTVAGSCQGTYVITRTWSLVDNCGNAADQQVQTITVSDTTRTSFTRPADITIYTDGSCGFDSTTAATGDVTNEADNCSTGINATYSDNTVAGSCQGTYVITRTWSLVDNCGNAADQQVQTITVSDTTRPTFTRPADITIYTDGSCGFDSTTAGTGDVTNEADNCSTGINATYSDNTIAGSCQGTYVITRTWSLVDNCGNAADQQVQTITVSDTTRPTFTRPADITIYTDGSCGFDSTTAATGDVTNEADNCSTGINATYSDNTVAGSCQGTYVITRTWSLVDNCGNAADQQVQTITVSDTTRPTFTRPVDITIYTDGSCGFDSTTAATGDVTNEADNCSTGINATYSDNTVAGSCQGTYVITRTWSLVDNCGNAADQQVQTITVSDTTRPTFTRPADITLYKNANCLADSSITATGDVTDETDNCSTGIEAIYTDSMITGCQGSYIIKRKWKLTDNCGNVSFTQTQTITVSDTTRPTFTRPADITIYTNSSCGFDSTTAATGDVTNETDNCSTGINATYSDVTVNGSCQGSKIITRTWTLADKCGNVAAPQIQTITVSDTTRPTFTRPANITIYSNSSCGFDSTTAATGDVTNEADNCSTGINATYSDVTVNGSCQGSKIITRTWTLVDKCGNAAAQQVQTITVSDTTRPTFTRPANITIYTNSSCGFDSTTAATGDVTDETDNCSTGINATYSDATVNGSCQGSKIITRTWTLVDKCGNPAISQVQTITVSDTTRPTFTRPANITIYTNSSCGFDSTTAATGDVSNETDNCSTGINATYSDVTVNGSCQGSKIITRTWTLVDKCGNAATPQIQTITVSDTTRPAFTSCPGSSFVYDRATDAGFTTYKAKNGEFDESATDNCHLQTLTYTLSGSTTGSGSNSLNGIDFNFGTTYIKWTATDACGNSDTCTFRVTIDSVTTDININNITVTPTSQQYSDIVSISATVSPWPSSPTPPLTAPSGKVVFYIGSEKMGEATVGSGGIATLNTPLLEIQSILDFNNYNAGNATNGQMKPGIKNVKVVFISSNPDYINDSATKTNCLTVTQEDAIVMVDNTESYFTVSPTSYKGTVWLKTLVEDINDMPPGARGDIRNATVQFKDGTSGSGSNIGPLRNVGLINPSDLTKGFALYTFDYTLNNTEIASGGKSWIEWADAGNYYAGSDRRDMNVVTLGLPGSEFVTGGGHYVMENSAGLYAGTAGKRMNFGFNMKWNSSGKNLQGQINLIFRREVNGVTRLYHVKSNAINSMTVSSTNFTDLDGATRSYSTSNMTTKATLTDVTDPMNNISLGGNMNLKLVAWDNKATGSDGRWDKISVELYDGSTSQLMFGSYFTGSVAGVRTINGGNINIRNTSPVTNTCAAPASLQASAITSSAASLSWSAISSAITYNLQYRPQGGIWTTVSVATNSYTLSGLSAGTTYEWTVQSVCSGGSSSLTTSTFATTADCSVAPTGLVTSGISSSSAVLNWSAASSVSQYLVEWRQQGSINGWSSATVNTNSYTLTGLTQATNYEWRVTNVCGTGTPVASITVLFSTASGCGTPFGLFESSVSTSGASLVWNSATSALSYNLQYRIVGSGSWTNVSGILTNGYSLSSLTSGTQYEWSVQSVCSGSITSDFATPDSFTTAVSCGIPSNLNTTNVTSSGAQLNWNVLSGATSYNVRYRIAGAASWTSFTGITTNSYTATGLTAGSNYEWGVQSVCGLVTGSWSANANFSTTAAGCNTPTGMTTTLISSSGATLGWTAVSGAASYNLQYRVQGTTTWSGILNTVNTSYALSGLTAITTYEWRVQTVCSGSITGNWSANISFVTTAAVCAPTNLQANGAINGTSATLTWSGPAGATYRLDYRRQGSTKWTTVTGVTSPRTLTRLTTGAIYEWRITAICGSVTGSTVNGPNFTVTYLAKNAEPANAPNETTVTVSTYPNPTTGLVNVKVDGRVQSSSKIQIVNTTGTIVSEFNIPVGGYVEAVKKIDLSTLSKGHYYLIFFDGNKQRIIRPIMLQ